jgi:hypothetical protein
MSGEVGTATGAEHFSLWKWWTRASVIYAAATVDRQRGGQGGGRRTAAVRRGLEELAAADGLPFREAVEMSLAKG